MKHQCCDKEKNEIIDCIVEEGVREGLIREENVFLRRAAVETQLSVYFMYRIAAEKKIELDLEADSLREYIYQNIERRNEYVNIFIYRANAGRFWKTACFCNQGNMEHYQDYC